MPAAQKLLVCGMGDPPLHDGAAARLGRAASLRLRPHPVQPVRHRGHHRCAHLGAQPRADTSTLSAVHSAAQCSTAQRREPPARTSLCVPWQLRTPRAALHVCPPRVGSNTRPCAAEISEEADVRNVAVTHVRGNPLKLADLRARLDMTEFRWARLHAPAAAAARGLTAPAPQSPGLAALQGACAGHARHPAAEGTIQPTAGAACRRLPPVQLGCTLRP